MLSGAVAVLELCASRGAAVLIQGANTGLTGGSTPHDGASEGRPYVLLSMRNVAGTAIVGSGADTKLLCLPGTGIRDVGRSAAALGRESHSVLGSTFLNPSVGAGVALGSGGTQVRKGPVYTERLLWARIDEHGAVELHNTLGVSLKLETPGGVDELMQFVDDGRVPPERLFPAGVASDTSYAERLCESSDRVARFNADTSGPDPCRSEGKVLVLASIHDTFPLPEQKEMFWISCRTMATADRLRKEVLLASPQDLPAVAEYMDRSTIEVVDGAARLLCFLLSKLSPESSMLQHIWDIKRWVETLPWLEGLDLVDRLLFAFNGLFPTVLPAVLAQLNRDFEHHLIVVNAESSRGSMERLRARLAAFGEDCEAGDEIVVHECAPEEAKKVVNCRFAAAPAFRTYCVGTGLQGLSIDYALPKTSTQAPAFAELPPIMQRMRYSHFACNVVHEDLAFAPNVDVSKAKKQVVSCIGGCNGRLPAEHGHGTEYVAPPETRERWMAMDPTNTLHPGVGGLSYEPFYGKQQQG
jgi:D-lactate dehydrogenase (quinone)